MPLTDRKISRKADLSPSEQRLALVLAFIFGVVFLGALLVFAIAFPNPTDRQFEIVRIILALAAGGVAAVIPGFLDLRLGSGKTWTIRAGGALAVFVIVYFYSPAHWVAPDVSACNGSVAAGRDASGNTVVINGNITSTSPCGGAASR